MPSDSITAQASAPEAAVSQPVSSPLTSAAILLVVTINPDDENRAPILFLCADSDMSTVQVPRGILDASVGRH
jgi:hypothetical protein